MLKENVVNGHHNVLEPKVLSSYCFYCLSNSPKHKDSLFTIINDKAKEQILTFKKLQPEYVWHVSEND